MTELTLEQCVLLVAGWLKKISSFSGEEARVSARDLPPGFTLTPEVFVERQSVLAREAASMLESFIRELRRSHASAVTITVHQWASLPEEVIAGRMDGHTANRRAAELNQKKARLEEEVARCDALLRMLSGAEKAVLPNMPLCQYTLSWKRFQETMNQGIDAAGKTGEDNHRFPHKPNGRDISGALKSMPRSDRMALFLAIVASCFILLFGYLYMYSWGRLHIEVSDRGENQFGVTFINSYGETVEIHVPYDGKSMSSDKLRCFGVFVELIGRDGNVELPPHLDTLWVYKDQPAHLYGPVLISPMSSEELTLELSLEELTEIAEAVRLTVYQSPHRRYITETISLHEPSKQ